MVQGPSFEAISTLGDVQVSTEQKVEVAKRLKNIIVGQDQRKELAVKHGIVQPLADILSAATKATGKRKVETNGVPLNQSQEWTPDDDLRLQATLIIGSLAAGGQAFLRPLCAADIPKLLVDTLLTDAAPRIVNAILQALKALATFWSTAEDVDIEYDLWSALFNVQSLATFQRILEQPASNSNSKQQLRLVADIFSVLPEGTYETKKLITGCGLLDTLAALLVAHAVANRIVWYTGEQTSPPAPPPDAALPSILAAISTVIRGSNYRAHRFILAPQVRDLFTRSGSEANDHRALFGARSGFANPHESLLPPLHIPTYRTVSHNPVSNHFPALRTLQSRTNGTTSSDVSQPIGDIDHSNAVVGWLLVLVRHMSGLNRLIGLRLLALVANAIEADPVTTIYKSDFYQKTRERQKQLSMLAVPLAVSLVKQAHEDKSEGVDEQQGGRGIREQACDVLALLVGGSKELQIAAVEAGAVKHVCPILKKSFDNVSLSKPMWSAKSNNVTDTANTPNTCRMGTSTFPREIAHAMRCRQGALRALEALAAREDVHRKAIIEHGVVSCIIGSMKPFPANAVADAASNRAILSPKDGNTTSVILAACCAAKSMSRSVSILRTSLIDGGIAKPLIHLLHHASLQIQTAATDVCCNLLPEFSPMREDLLEHNVIKTLVGHARSSSPALRLSSLWALKHLVYGCPKEIKLNTLEELGTGWLVDTIHGEHREGGQAVSGGVSVGLSTPNAAGEQVDLLNPSSMDVDEPVGEETMDEDDDDGEVLYDEASSTHYQASQLRSTLNPPAPMFNSRRYLSSIREMEHDDDYASRRDEAAIQTQALDFLRNLINGDDCGALSDHLMNQIGSAKVYELLTAKLSPLPRSLAGGKPVYHPTELVLSTIHVIIHLANASLKHRQMLIAQKPLLQAMLPHFNHTDHRVRVMSVWAVNSLTWIEENDDRRDARQRASELRALGIEQAVKALQGDPNLDVRERVKTAIRQFDTL
ncbi:armadillo repeat [Lecanosticta acicola]|uniref:Armadillo repeat, partial n=1 Tax=Lecanosticta acicola TaxID=111012 RepID=A0AAI9E9Y7_9PEZI|nr:armadillo repeat [Lecanosticta acicola]